MKINSFYQVIFLASILFCSCKYDDGEDYILLYPEENEQYLGGTTTIFDASVNAFSFQAPNLNSQEQLDFFVGNSLFNKNWVVAPASTTARDGLGPLFNARACSGCHFKDGRGRPPYTDDEVSSGLLLRLAIGNDPIHGPIPDPNYGNQLQDRAIPGVPVEANFRITYEYISSTYPDGTPYELRKPTYHLENFTQGQMTATEISPRVAGQMIGLGLLEAIDEQEILKNADPNDINGDGISGKPNYVFNVESNTSKLGRFGWKANQPTIRQQVAGAFSGDMGLTSSIFPEENIPPSHTSIPIPNGGSPEVEDDALAHVTLYSSVLGVPIRRNFNNQDVLRGRNLFNEIECGACHIPKIKTGNFHPIKALRNQIIRPYTDLLLHDMGDELADNAGDFLATGREWRTPPLWGIGLIETVNKHTLLLHDGRARSIEEAILWHGGEAEQSKQQFMNLSKEDREKLIKFINTL